MITITASRPKLRRLAALDENLRVPNNGMKFVQFKHDWEFKSSHDPQYDYRPRQIAWHENSPIPAQVNEMILKAPDAPYIPAKYRGRPYDYVELPVPWQFFLFNVFRSGVLGYIKTGKIESTYQLPNEPGVIYRKCTPNSAAEIWEWMMRIHRWLTDSRPIEKGFQDLVLGSNIGAQNHTYLLKPSTGNIAHVIGNERHGDLFYWRVEALDVFGGAPPNVEELKQKPWLYHHATEQSVQRLPNKSYVVDRFAIIKTIARALGYPLSGVPYPFLSIGGSVLVEAERMKELAPGQEYSLYTPAK